MIRVEVLGGLRVFDDGRELSAFQSKPKRAALLAYLAVEREVSREQVCFLLWPDSDDSAARHALSQTLSELTRDLTGAWLEKRGDRLVATTRLQTDLDAFEKVIDTDEPAAAIELYRGPFLEGVQLSGGLEFERWIEGKRSKLHRSVRAGFKGATVSAVGHQRRIELARAWVDLDPLDDEAQHALIEALAESGQRTPSLQQYEEYKALIWAELEVEPLDQTQELIERIKRGEFARQTKASAPHPRRGLEGAVHEESLSRTGSSTPDLGPELEVVRKLREGSTGSVYLAREPALRRLVTVKVVHATLADHATAIRRLQREALLAAKVLHPNVPAVLRAGVTADDRPFFVMPNIKGVTLADRVAARGPLPSYEAARLLAEVSSALAAAHAKKVVHRDVRPGTVLCEDETQRAYLADFGVAGFLDSESGDITRLTEKGEVLGDPEYVSPEAQAGEELDDRSDVYSLGVLGGELLMGRPPREAAELTATSPKDIPFAEVLRRAMAKRPEHRPSAADLARDLKRIAEEYDRRGGLVGDLRKRRMPQFVAAYLAAGVAGMGGVDQLVQQDLLGPIAYRLALAFFVAGLNATIVLAWFHGERGRQRVSRVEVLLLAAVFIGWVIATIVMLL